jgi:hypothetical protein
MTVADTINSHKSKDHNITDKLPQMLLATTKLPQAQLQIFYFHTGKNLVWLIHKLLLFPNSSPKNLGAVYTPANIVTPSVSNTYVYGLL